MPLYADIYLLLNYAACFGHPSCTSSGVHKTVAAASGTDHTIWEADFFKPNKDLWLCFTVLSVTIKVALNTVNSTHTILTTRCHTTT